MIKFPRFFLAIIAVIAISPSVGFAAAGAGGPGEHPLVKASPVRQAILADPMYQLFQRKETAPRPCFETLEEFTRAVDAVVATDVKDLWALHPLLNEAGRFNKEQSLAASKYVLGKVEGLRTHADPNMCAMAMYAWARSKWDTLDRDQGDEAKAVLREAFTTEGMSEWLKVKLAHKWWHSSNGFDFGAPDASEGAESLDDAMYGYNVLLESDTLLRPFVLCAKSKRLRKYSASRFPDKSLSILRDAVEGSGTDPYYLALAKIIEASLSQTCREEHISKKFNDKIKPLEDLRIKALEEGGFGEDPLQIPGYTLPSELQAWILSYYLDYSKSINGNSSQAEKDVQMAGVLRYGKAILDLGTGAPRATRECTELSMLPALAHEDPKAAVALWDMLEPQVKKKWVRLDRRGPVIRLLIYNDSVRDIAKAQEVLGKYEKLAGVDEVPYIYALQMELYASEAGFNQEALMIAAQKLAAKAKEDPFIYNRVCNAPQVTIKILVAAGRNDAATAISDCFKDVKSPEAWRPAS